MAEKITLMKEGYTLRVTSWENDADNYRTIDIAGLSKEEVKGLVAVCDYCSKTNTESSIANEDSVSEEAKKRINKILEEHPILNQYIVDIDEYENPINDITNMLFGYSEWYLCRVCDKYEIFYTPEDILVDKLSIEDLN